MPNFYSRQLSKTLAEYVDQQLSLDPSEQLNLLQELALMRECAGNAVALWSAAQTVDSNEIKANAAIIMADALKNVKDMCQAAVSVEAARKDKLDGVALSMVLDQIVRLAYDAFGDDGRARDFEILVRERIKVPGATESATVTPDEQVREMMRVTTGIGAGPTEDGNEESGTGAENTGL